MVQLEKERATMKKPLMKKLFGGRGDDCSWGQATGGGGTHVLMCWALTLSGVGLASGLPCSRMPFWLPPLEDDACHDEHLHAPIFRGAWVPPHEDDTCHDEHNAGGGDGGGGDRPCAWRRRWW